MSSFKTGTLHKKLQPGTVLIGPNGLPVNTIATIASSYRIIQKQNTPLTYLAGVVTVDNGIDLDVARNHKARYTGKLILTTKDGAIYFIDRLSINNTNKTFSIYNDADFTNIPATIDVSVGWIVAEAEIHNKLATTTSAKIDQVEFNDVQFQMDLEGESVGIVGDNGNRLEPNPDGSINIGGTVVTDVDLTAVEQKLDQLIGEAEAANDTLLEIEGAVKNTNVIYGTSDGTPTGQANAVLYGMRQKILDAPDREQAFTYEDFGAKTERITEIAYTTSLEPTVILKKILEYTQVGTKYRLDNIKWSIE